MAPREKDKPVTQNSDEFLNSEVASVAGSGGITVDTGMPARTLVSTVQRGSMVTGSTNNFYYGNNRINAQNKFDLDPKTNTPRQQYNESEDPIYILAGLEDTDRQSLLNQVQKALAGTVNYKPSKLGTSDNDQQAFGLVLRTANLMGRTWDVALDYMVKNYGQNSIGSGAAKRYETTNADDIGPVANQLALKYLGRTLSPDALTRIVKGIQAEEVKFQQASGVVQQPAQLQNAVQQAVLSEDPMEAEVQGAATLGDWFQKALGA